MGYQEGTSKQPTPAKVGETTKAGLTPCFSYARDGVRDGARNPDADRELGELEVKGVMTRATKVLIAVPATDTIPTQTAYSLLTLERDCPSRVSFIVRLPVHEAREKLAHEAIDGGADRVLWIDSDMVFSSDLMKRLGDDMDETGADAVAGLYFKRELPTSPVIYKAVDAVIEPGTAEQHFDYPRDTLFDVAGFGFGAVMMKTGLLRRVHEGFGRMFTPISGLSEDLSFCWRAAGVGARMLCDSRIKVGHVGLITYGEAMYKHPDNA